MLGLGTDPDDVVQLDDLGELGVLRQEAVARVDRVGVDDFGGRDDVGDVEVAVARGGRADADGFVGKADVHGVGVGGGMHRHRPDSELLGGAQDPKRDLAAVGDQQLVDGTHDYSMTTSGWSNSTGCALATISWVILPPRGALIGFITFIASTISRVSPCFTVSPTLTKLAEPGSAAR